MLCVSRSVLQLHRHAGCIVAPYCDNTFSKLQSIISHVMLAAHCVPTNSVLHVCALMKVLLATVVLCTHQRCEHGVGRKNMWVYLGSLCYSQHLLAQGVKIIQRLLFLYSLDLPGSGKKMSALIFEIPHNLPCQYYHKIIAEVVGNLTCNQPPTSCQLQILPELASLATATCSWRFDLEHSKAEIAMLLEYLTHVLNQSCSNELSGVTAIQPAHSVRFVVFTAVYTVVCIMHQHSQRDFPTCTQP